MARFVCSVMAIVLVAGISVAEADLTVNIPTANVLKMATFMPDAVYVAAANDGVIVVNVEKQVVASTIPIPEGQVADLCLEWDRSSVRLAVLIVSSSEMSSEVRYFSLEDPLDPVVVDRVYLTGLNGQKVSSLGAMTYVVGNNQADYHGDTVAVGINRTEAVHEIAWTFSVGSSGGSVWFSRNLLFVASSAGNNVSVWRLSAKAPIKKGRLRLPSPASEDYYVRCEGIQVWDGKAYVLYSYAAHGVDLPNWRLGKASLKELSWRRVVREAVEIPFSEYGGQANMRMQGPQLTLWCNRLVERPGKWRWQFAEVRAFLAPGLTDNTHQLAGSPETAQQMIDVSREGFYDIYMTRGGSNSKLWFYSLFDTPLP